MIPHNASCSPKTGTASRPGTVNPIYSTEQIPMEPDHEPFPHQVVSPPIFLKCDCLADDPNSLLQKPHKGNNHHVSSNPLPPGFIAQDLLLPHEPLNCAPILIPPLKSEELELLCIIIIYPSIHPSPIYPPIHPSLYPCINHLSSIIHPSTPLFIHDE